MADTPVSVAPLHSHKHHLLPKDHPYSRIFHHGQLCLGLTSTEVGSHTELTLGSGIPQESLCSGAWLPSL